MSTLPPTIRIADGDDSLTFPLGLHPVEVPGGVLLHDPAADALLGRLDGQPFESEGEAMAAADWVERMRMFQNS